MSFLLFVASQHDEFGSISFTCPVIAGLYAKILLSIKCSNSKNQAQKKKIHSNTRENYNISDAVGIYLLLLVVWSSVLLMKGPNLDDLMSLQ